ncbi:SET domain-containing protein [Parendozoicomonas sp. Alg238-R29]|uniref:SET domain-containing protein-lysine N-methyltransferase n=1 Tax=Parendozoicomonas sp. Alg238-R29 TaxID=2993446 RepID=UPI00248EAE9C|nr:SET domain-containing protein [Parendozoicomonas sp. Alg238-R29]
MPGNSRIPSGAIHTHTSIPQESAGLESSAESTRKLDDVDRKLADSSNPEWERHITLQGIPVVPVPILPDLSLVRMPEEENVKPRKRKASAIQILTRYWDNRAPMHHFGQEADWLYKRLSSGQHKTRLVMPEGIRPKGKRRSLTSTPTWEGIVETWLGMEASDRASTLEKTMKHVTLPENDTRLGLRGQSGVLAASDIDEFTVLGPYLGKYCHGQDLQVEQGIHGHNVGRYAVDCSMDTLRLDLCGYGYGNVTVCINANTTYRPGEPVFQDNAFFTMVIYRGWPYIYVVSKQRINKGEEILVDYGRFYWLGY